jgi:hypothetical protein
MKKTSVVCSIAFIAICFNGQLGFAAAGDPLEPLLKKVNMEKEQINKKEKKVTREFLEKQNKEFLKEALDIIEADQNKYSEIAHNKELASKIVKMKVACHESVVNDHCPAAIEQTIELLVKLVSPLEKKK